MESGVKRLRDVTVVRMVLGHGPPVHHVVRAALVAALHHALALAHHHVMRLVAPVLRVKLILGHSRVRHQRLA